MGSISDLSLSVFQGVSIIQPHGRQVCVLDCLMVVLVWQGMACSLARNKSFKVTQGGSSRDCTIWGSSLADHPSIAIIPDDVLQYQS